MGCWSVCQTLLSHAHNSPFSSLGRVEEGDDDHLDCQAWMVIGDDDDFHHGDRYHQMPVKQLKHSQIRPSHFQSKVCVF